MRVLPADAPHAPALSGLTRASAVEVHRLDDNPMDDAAFLTSLQTALETNRLPERVAEGASARAMPCNCEQDPSPLLYPLWIARRRREAQANVAEADTTPDVTPGSTPAVTAKPGTASSFSLLRSLSCPTLN